jgi:DNA-binding HxlR family transcriptional regulator
MSEQAPKGLRLAPRRTIALLHLGTHGRASNREIAAAVGIADDAQISSLLARMRDLGLVVNRTPPNSNGGPNAWELTADGRRLVSALKQATQPL